MARMSDQARTVTDQVEALGDEDKKQLVKEVQKANSGLFPAGDKERTKIWMTVVTGLLVVAILGLFAVVYLLMQSKEVDVVAALATAALGGVIGLFAQSPTSGGTDT